MSYVLQLKGRLQELKIRQMEHETSIKAKLKAALEILARAHWAIQEIDIESAYTHLKEARRQKVQLQKVLGEIREIERELGES